MNPCGAVVSLGKCSGSLVVSRGVFVVTGLGGVGGGVGGLVTGGSLVTGFKAGLVVAGLGTNLVIGLCVGLVVGFGLGLIVVLKGGLAVAGGLGGLMGCLTPPVSGILFVMPPLPLGKVVFPLKTVCGPDGSIITLGIAGGGKTHG